MLEPEWRVEPKVGANVGCVLSFIARNTRKNINCACWYVVKRTRKIVQ